MPCQLLWRKFVKKYSYPKSLKNSFNILDKNFNKYLLWTFWDNGTMTNSNLTFPQKNYHFRTDFKLEHEIHFEDFRLVCQVHKRNQSVTELSFLWSHWTFSIHFYFPADSACHAIEFQLGTGCYWIKSLTSEAIPSATQFFKRAYKISNFPRL